MDQGRTVLDGLHTSSTTILNKAVQNQDIELMSDQLNNRKLNTQKDNQSQKILEQFTIDNNQVIVPHSVNEIDQKSEDHEQQLQVFDDEKENVDVNEGTINFQANINQQVQSLEDKLSEKDNENNGQLTQQQQIVQQIDLHQFMIKNEIKKKNQKNRSQQIKMLLKGNLKCQLEQGVWFDKQKYRPKSVNRGFILKSYFSYNEQKLIRGTKKMQVQVAQDGRKNKQRKVNFEQVQQQIQIEDMYNENHLRRKSCHCSECGQLSQKAIKFFYIPFTPQNQYRKKLIAKRISKIFPVEQQLNIQRMSLSKKSNGGVGMHFGNGGQKIHQVVSSNFQNILKSQQQKQPLFLGIVQQSNSSQKKQNIKIMNGGNLNLNLISVLKHKESGEPSSNESTTQLQQQISEPNTRQNYLPSQHQNEDQYNQKKTNQTQQIRQSSEKKSSFISQQLQNTQDVNDNSMISEQQQIMTKKLTRQGTVFFNKNKKVDRSLPRSNSFNLKKERKKSDLEEINEDQKQNEDKNEQQLQLQKKKKKVSIAGGGAVIRDKSGQKTNAEKNQVQQNTMGEQPGQVGSDNLKRNQKRYSNTFVCNGQQLQQLHEQNIQDKKGSKASLSSSITPFIINQNKSTRKSTFFQAQIKDLEQLTGRRDSSPDHNIDSPSLQHFGASPEGCSTKQLQQQQQNSVNIEPLFQFQNRYLKQHDLDKQAKMQNQVLICHADEQPVANQQAQNSQQLLEKVFIFSEKHGKTMLSPRFIQQQLNEQQNRKDGNCNIGISRVNQMLKTIVSNNSQINNKSGNTLQLNTSASKINQSRTIYKTSCLLGNKIKSSSNVTAFSSGIQSPKTSAKSFFLQKNMLAEDTVNNQRSRADMLNNVYFNSSSSNLSRKVFNSQNKKNYKNASDILVAIGGNNTQCGDQLEKAIKKKYDNLQPQGLKQGGIQQTALFTQTKHLSKQQQQQLKIEMNDSQKLKSPITSKRNQEKQKCYSLYMTNTAPSFGQFYNPYTAIIGQGKMVNNSKLN